MPTKVIFTHPGHALPDSFFYHSILKKRISHSNQLKLTDLSINEADMQLWFCELATKGIDIGNLEIKFPKNNPFANWNNPEPHDEGAKKIKVIFDRAKSQYLTNTNGRKDNDLQTIVVIESILIGAPLPLNSASNFIYKYQHIVEFYKQLNTCKCFNEPLIQNNLQILLKNHANGMPVFLDRLQSIGALNQNALDKLSNFRKSDTNYNYWSYSSQKYNFSSQLNDERLWKLLHRFSKEQAQRIFIKILNSHQPEQLIDFILSDEKVLKYNALDFENWLDKMLKIKNLNNYQRLLNTDIIHGINVFDLPDPDSYLALMNRVVSFNANQMPSNRIPIERINNLEPGLFPILEKAASNTHLNYLLNNNLSILKMPQEFYANFYLHMSNIPDPVGVILYLEFMRVVLPQKFEEISQNMDDLKNKMRTDSQFEIWNKFDLANSTLFFANLAKYSMIKFFKFDRTNLFCDKELC